MLHSVLQGIHRKAVDLLLILRLPMVKRHIALDNKFAGRVCWRLEDRGVGDIGSESSRHDL